MRALGSVYRWRGGRASGEGAVYSERGTGGRVATLGWQRGALGGLALGQSSEGQGQPGAGQEGQRGLRTQDGACRMVPPCSIHGTDNTSRPGGRDRGRGRGPVWGSRSDRGGQNIPRTGVSASGGGQGGFGGGSGQRLLRTGVTPVGAAAEEAAQVSLLERQLEDPPTIILQWIASHHLRYEDERRVECAQVVKAEN